MDTRTIEDLIKGHPFFRSMRPENIAFLAGCGTDAQFAAGETIFRSGEPADAFYILRAGRAAVEVSAADGDPLTIQTVEAGEVLGWSWIFPPYVWHFDARAVEPVQAVAMDGRCLRQKCETTPQLGYELMKRFCSIMIGRLEATRLQLLDIYGPRKG